jgi:protein-disulfide isomerase
MRLAGGGPVSIPANVTVTEADTTGFRGYILGSESATIEVTEYADFQCPGCGAFATVQFPDLKARLIDTGKIRFRYRDFPLDGAHVHARLAAHSAACANDQGKFWEMEDRIYQRQNDWAMKGSALPIFEEIAKAVGLDTGAWKECMQSAKYAGRIQASLEEGSRVGVQYTPSFLIGGRIYSGLNADDIVRMVDSMITAQAATPTP